jgi:hypothetical protein
VVDAQHKAALAPAGAQGDPYRAVWPARVWACRVAAGAREDPYWADRARASASADGWRVDEAENKAAELAALMNFGAAHKQSHGAIPRTPLAPFDSSYGAIPRTQNCYGRHANSYVREMSFEIV